MANTTIKGALAIHGQNPQVCICSTFCISLSLIRSVLSRNCDSKPDMGVDVLEGTLFRVDRCVHYCNVLEVWFIEEITAESLIDKAIELRCIGGVYGNQRPTEFLSLLLKLLQIQPQKEILIEYLQADEFKYASSCFSPWITCLDLLIIRYMRALAAMYVRMTFRAVEVYEILEPLMKDYRRLRYRDMCTFLGCFRKPR